MTDRRDLFAAAALAGRFTKAGYLGAYDMEAIWRDVDRFIAADPRKAELDAARAAA